MKDNQESISSEQVLAQFDGVEKEWSALKKAIMANDSQQIILSRKALLAKISAINKAIEELPQGSDSERIETLKNNIKKITYPFNDQFINEYKNKYCQELSISLKELLEEYREIKRNALEIVDAEYKEFLSLETRIKAISSAQNSLAKHAANITTLKNKLRNKLKQSLIIKLDLADFEEFSDFHNLMVKRIRSEIQIEVQKMFRHEILVCRSLLEDIEEEQRKNSVLLIDLQARNEFISNVHKNLPAIQTKIVETENAIGSINMEIEKLKKELKKHNEVKTEIHADSILQLEELDDIQDKVYGYITKVQSNIKNKEDFKKAFKDITIDGYSYGYEEFAKELDLSVHKFTTEKFIKAILAKGNIKSTANNYVVATEILKKLISSKIEQAEVSSEAQKSISLQKISKIIDKKEKKSVVLKNNLRDLIDIKNQLIVKEKINLLFNKTIRLTPLPTEKKSAMSSPDVVLDEKEELSTAEQIEESSPDVVLGEKEELSTAEQMEEPSPDVVLDEKEELSKVEQIKVSSLDVLLGEKEELSEAKVKQINDLKEYQKELSSLRMEVNSLAINQDAKNLLSRTLNDIKHNLNTANQIIADHEQDAKHIYTKTVLKTVDSCHQDLINITAEIENKIKEIQESKRISRHCLEGKLPELYSNFCDLNNKITTIESNIALLNLHYNDIKLHLEKLKIAKNKLNVYLAEFSLQPAPQPQPELVPEPGPAELDAEVKKDANEVALVRTYLANNSKENLKAIVENVQFDKLPGVFSELQNEKQKNQPMYSLDRLIAAKNDIYKGMYDNKQRIIKNVKHAAIFMAASLLFPVLLLVTIPQFIYWAYKWGRSQIKDRTLTQEQMKLPQEAKKPAALFNKGGELKKCLDYSADDLAVSKGVRVLMSKKQANKFDKKQTGAALPKIDASDTQLSNEEAPSPKISS